MISERKRVIQLNLPLFGEAYLVASAVGLGAASVGGPLSAGEQRLVAKYSKQADVLTGDDLVHLGDAISRGEDPLGDALLALRPQAERRSQGAVYTPHTIISPMVGWALNQNPSRIVDAGCGSGRFVSDIARRKPSTKIVAIDTDPLATLMTRAVLATVGRGEYSVINADYTRVRLPQFGERTAFIGNPPYVRHHDLSPNLKAWAQRAARTVGQQISGLAGLHAYFFLATAIGAKKDDVGTFVTSSEWLDVNYGAVIRALLLDGLGGQSIHFLEPAATPFHDTATTAAITCFRVGDRPRSMRLRRVKTLKDLGDLSGGRPIARDRLLEARRWTPLIRAKSVVPEGFIELGELCRVHRGAVTGANSVWIKQADDLSLPESVLFPSVTRARELFAAGEVLADADQLRRVIDLPADLDELDSHERTLVETFLRSARKLGADLGYIARTRPAWWSVRLREPAPILATYMARRPPAFVRNLVDARHINIAHGLYPRIDLSPLALDRLAACLRTSITMAQGRTYAGGLTKFEPKEMERLPVPDLPLLLAP